MPHARTFALALALAALAACTPKPADNASGSGQSTASGGDPDVGALGPAKFSAVIDGEATTGGPIGSDQLENTAHFTPDPKGGQDLLIWLYDAQPVGSDTFRHALRLSIPAKNGAQTANLSATINLDPTHTAKYYNEAALVTITTLTSSRVAGTFSTQMKLSPDTPNAPHQTISVTGTFDVPMATSKLLPP